MIEFMEDELVSMSILFRGMVRFLGEVRVWSKDECVMIPKRIDRRRRGTFVVKSGET